MSVELRCNKDTLGRYLTHAMFFETKTAGYEPTFTLKEHDHEYEGVKYISMRQRYLEMADPTEYQFAIEVLGSWDHWQKLCNSSLIRTHIDQWRDELTIKLRAQAIQALVKSAVEGGIKGITAAKWLATGSWQSGRGRPSKVEKERKLKQETRLDAETESHIKLLEEHRRSHS
jgi:hypothetical protein